MKYLILKAIPNTNLEKGKVIRTVTNGGINFKGAIHPFQTILTGHIIPEEVAVMVASKVLQPIK